MPLGETARAAATETLDRALDAFTWPMPDDERELAWRRVANPGISAAASTVDVLEYGLEEQAMEMVAKKLRQEGLHAKPQSVRVLPKFGQTIIEPGDEHIQVGVEYTEEDLPRAVDFTHTQMAFERANPDWKIRRDGNTLIVDVPLHTVGFTGMAIGNLQPSKRLAIDLAAETGKRAGAQLLDRAQRTAAQLENGLAEGAETVIGIAGQTRELIEMCGPIKGILASAGRVTIPFLEGDDAAPASFDETSPCTTGGFADLHDLYARQTRGSLTSRVLRRIPPFGILKAMGDSGAEDRMAY